VVQTLFDVGRSLRPPQPVVSPTRDSPTPGS
jgi:hypothetical protein